VQPSAPCQHSCTLYYMALHDAAPWHPHYSLPKPFSGPPWLSHNSDTITTSSSELSPKHQHRCVHNNTQHPAMSTLRLLHICPCQSICSPPPIRTPTVAIHAAQQVPRQSAPALSGSYASYIYAALSTAVWQGHCHDPHCFIHRPHSASSALSMTHAHAHGAHPTHACSAAPCDSFHSVRAQDHDLLTCSPGITRSYYGDV
jgi:hypothetical protein